MLTRSKTLLLVAGGVAVVATGAFAIDFIADANDPTESVNAVSLGDLDASSPTAPGPADSTRPAAAPSGGTVDPSGPDASSSSTAPGPADSTRPAAAPSGGAVSQQIIALEELTGTLAQRGDDVDDYAIGEVELDFGPESWVLGAGPLEDYDGDGSAEALRDELDALTGNEIRVLVRLDDDRDDADVYVLNDQPYRDPDGGPAPWQTPATDEAATREQLIAAAESAVGDGSRVTDLDEDDGTAGWDAEVVAADGRHYDVILSATAEVLQVRRDN